MHFPSRNLSSNLAIAAVITTSKPAILIIWNLQKLQLHPLKAVMFEIWKSFIIKQTDFIKCGVLFIYCNLTFNCYINKITFFMFLTFYFTIFFFLFPFYFVYMCIYISMLLSGEELMWAKGKSNCFNNCISLVKYSKY